jgi:hypothetical protein
MKDIEKIIKESIEHYEAPYNPDAWSKLSGRLDATPVVSATVSSFKWLWIAASTVVAITGLSLWYYTNTRETSTPENQLTQLTEKETKANQFPSEQKKSTEKEEQTKETTSNLSFTSQESKVLDAHQPTYTEIPNDYMEVVGEQERKKPETVFAFKTPIISGSLCVGSDVFISNPNEAEVGVLCNGRLMHMVAAKANVKIKLVSAGTYTYSRKSEIFAAFEVKDAPKVDFIAEELLYDNGLPFNHMKAIGSASSFEWVNKKGDVLSTQREFDAHFYSKGSHEITLQAKQNGCVNTVKKVVQVETDYNLLAVTGFNPEHPDPRRQTFIPYALLVRNVSFHLSIIDPKTGAVVYTTSDASQPWDGRDKRTGELVPTNASYIWKVTLFNPEPHEKSEYKGIIVRI